MPHARFLTQMRDPFGLLDLAASVTGEPQNWKNVPVEPELAPLLAGSVLLASARFEQFLKDLLNAAIDHFEMAQPPLRLDQLGQETQMYIISEASKVALAKSRYGTLRDTQDRLSSHRQLTRDLYSEKISFGEVVQTGGNASPDTVAALLKLIGLTSPWPKIQDSFERLYIEPQIPGLPTGRRVSLARDELVKFNGYRNAAAHNGSALPISPAEARFSIDFLCQLGAALYQIVPAHVNELVSSAHAVPRAWPEAGSF